MLNQSLDKIESLQKEVNDHNTRLKVLEYREEHDEHNNYIILWLASLGAFSTLTSIAWKYGRSHVKNVSLQNAGDIFLQGVQYAEQVAGSKSGAEQKQVATDFINKALSALHIEKLFTAEQVSSKIELALLELKKLDSEVTK